MDKKESLAAGQLDELPEAKPILKWAGGKTQMLGQLLDRLLPIDGTYIEPFFGGGALFFAARPQRAVISDSNPDLINLYRAVAEDVTGVIDVLRSLEVSEKNFYKIRSQDTANFSSVEAAARTIYLNRTCFNGLYRVNRQGRFNVPWGKYKNPRILNEGNLRNASAHLQGAIIECDDYQNVLFKHAIEGDVVFLDPPYIPISKNSDFKRYTAQQFIESDHLVMGDVIKGLREKGCRVILTNSNHSLIYDLYGEFDIDVIQTRRNINSRGHLRGGEDVIVHISP